MAVPQAKDRVAVAPRVDGLPEMPGAVTTDAETSIGGPTVAAPVERAMPGPP